MGLGCQLPALELVTSTGDVIQMHLNQDLINTGSIRILYMTFEHRLKKLELTVMLLKTV